MPDIPNVPGVPPLSSYGPNNITLLIADLVSFLIGSSAPQWGIYQDGEPVIDADSTVSFEFKQDFPVSDYPVEDGGFQSYDKVQLPSEIRVRVSSGGSVANRQALLTSIASVMNTTELYDVLTPEAVYLGYNFTHMDFKRDQMRAGLLVVDLWLTEIRVTSTATFTNTQQPAEAGQQNTGNVQPQTAPGNVQQDFSNGDAEVQ